MTNLTKYLEKLKRLESEAAPAPWTYAYVEYADDPEDKDYIGIKSPKGDNENPDIYYWPEGSIGEPNNTEKFIAASRTAIPLLIKIIERQAEALGDYADKDFYCLFEDINWTDNWIAERPHPQRLEKVGHTARCTRRDIESLLAESEGEA